MDAPMNIFVFLSETQKMTTNIVQYVIVRKDVLKTFKWPVGALIAQACHACTAVIHVFYQNSDTQSYLKDLDRMHKVILEVDIVIDIFEQILICKMIPEYFYLFIVISVIF